MSQKQYRSKVVVFRFVCISLSRVHLLSKCDYDIDTN